MARPPLVAAAPLSPPASPSHSLEIAFSAASLLGANAPSRHRAAKSQYSRSGFLMRSSKTVCVQREPLARRKIGRCAAGRPRSSFRSGIAPHPHSADVSRWQKIILTHNQNASKTRKASTVLCGWRRYCFSRSFFRPSGIRSAHRTIFI